MTSKAKKLKWTNVKDTERYVARDLSEANVYLHLLFHFFRPIAVDNNQEVQKGIGATYHFLALACESACVLSLAKVFAKDEEPALDRLVQLAVDTPEEVADRKLTEMQKKLLHDHYREHRRKFLENAPTYLETIKNIREAVSPLRNTQRAHNFPDMARRAKVTWPQFTEWLRFGERVCYQAANAAGESALAEGHYLAVGFDKETQYLLKIIRSHFAKLRQDGDV